MARSIIHGFGGSIVSSGSFAASFPNCKGNVKFVEEYMEWYSRSKRYIRKFIGWRPVITIMFTNLDDLSSNALVELILAINNSKNLNVPLNVKPRYNTGLNYGMDFDCELITDIDIEDISELAVAQNLELTFRAIDKIQNVPIFRTDLSVLNSTAKYGGTTYNMTAKYGGTTHNLTIYD